MATAQASKDDEPTKPTSYFAPIYTFVVPILMSEARKYGYAITVHGSMNNDLDVVAIPWTYDAVPAEELVVAITKKCCIFWATDEKGEWYQTADEQWAQLLKIEDVALKPHGRKAWNIQLGNGARIDISVMPRFGPPAQRP